jgi:type I restriction enzyme S subunit
MGRLLGALDEKIELNRRMNATLEALARTIYKDWFVDFGPTHAMVEGRAACLATSFGPFSPPALIMKGNRRTGSAEHSVTSQSK